MDKLKTFEVVGKGNLLTFVDEKGFITQVRLDEEGLKLLRATIDEHLWQTDGRHRIPIKE